MSKVDNIAAILHETRRVAREREIARDLIERLRPDEELFDRELPESWKTLGFVKELAAASARAIDSNLDAALRYAQIALVVATAVPPSSYPRVLRLEAEASAWRELASAHKFRSEYAPALRAIDAGESLLAAVPALSYDRLLFQYSRALVYADMHRLGDADELLQAVVSGFSEFGDQRRVVDCILLRGMIAHRRGDLQRAVADYEHVISIAEAPNVILILEPDRRYVDVARHAIAGQSITPIFADDGVDVMKSLKAWPPRLIVLSAAVPNIAGLIRGIREHNQRLAETPILLTISGDADAQRAGASDVLLKPYSDAEFLRKVETMLGRADEAAAPLVLQPNDTVRSVASAYNNLACALVELDKLDRAASAYQNAYAIFRELGASTDVARVRAGLGRMLLASGKYAEACNAFIEARIRFLSLKMVEEAAVVGLDLADTCLALGNVEDAQQSIDAVIAACSRADLDHQLMIALSYAQELVTSPRARAAVEHVREYVATFEANPRLVFLPLPD
jgi:DNA-binding response OmpR family regulator